MGHIYVKNYISTLSFLDQSKPSVYVGVAYNSINLLTSFHMARGEVASEYTRAL